MSFVVLIFVVVLNLGNFIIFIICGNILLTLAFLIAYAGEAKFYHLESH